MKKRDKNPLLFGVGDVFEVPDGVRFEVVNVYEVLEHVNLRRVGGVLVFEVETAALLRHCRPVIEPDPQSLFTWRVDGDRYVRASLHIDGCRVGGPGVVALDGRDSDAPLVDWLCAGEPGGEHPLAAEHVRDEQEATR